MGCGKIHFRSWTLLVLPGIVHISCSDGRFQPYVAPDIDRRASVWRRLPENITTDSWQKDHKGIGVEAGSFSAECRE